MIDKPLDGNENKSGYSDVLGYPAFSHLYVKKIKQSSERRNLLAKVHQKFFVDIFSCFDQMELYERDKSDM